MLKTLNKYKNNPWSRLGNVLLVGEGNLSFSKSLLKFKSDNLTNITATTYESFENLSDNGKNNSAFLKKSGCRVFHSIDATKLEDHFRQDKFDSIIFQFPNIGSREPKFNHNPNHILIRNFLRSAKTCLRDHGKIIITVIDSPYYDGIFNIEEACKFAKCKIEEIYSFDPSKFYGYVHTNTNNNNSAIDKNDIFKTIIFGKL